MTLTIKNKLSELREFLLELKDTDDSGARGKSFENVFSQALTLLGVDFDSNLQSGPGWDIRTKGEKWLGFLSQKKVNIKVYGTKWMVSSSKLEKDVPWSGLPAGYSREETEKKVRRILNTGGLPDIFFLKPKDAGVQEKIVSATKLKDIVALQKLFVKKNFMITRLGRKYGLKVLDNGERVTSIAILKDGKVFMRSEKPRKTGRSSVVAFRTPTMKISDKNRAVVKKD